MAKLALSPISSIDYRPRADLASYSSTEMGALDAESYWVSAPIPPVPRGAILTIFIDAWMSVVIGLIAFVMLPSKTVPMHITVIADMSRRSSEYLCFVMYLSVNEHYVTVLVFYISLRILMFLSFNSLAFW